MVVHVTHIAVELYLRCYSLGKYLYSLINEKCLYMPKG